MFTFLLVVHAIIAAALVAVILMQRSEGGGLGMGGSPSGLMSARGAADFLTRATTILASAFILMSIGLAALASFQRGPRDIDTSLARQTAPTPAAPAVPLAADPLAAAAAGAAANGPSSGTGAIVPATPGTVGPATAPARTEPASRTAPVSSKITAPRAAPARSEATPATPPAAPPASSTPAPAVVAPAESAPAPASTDADALSDAPTGPLPGFGVGSGLLAQSPARLWEPDAVGH